MKKLLICFGIIILSLINFIFAQDSQTMIVCGGDGQTIIQCIGDNQNSITGYQQKITGSITTLGVSAPNIFLYSLIGIFIISILIILIAIDKRNKKLKRKV